MSEPQRLATPPQSQVSMLDIEKFRSTPLCTAPFSYAVVENFVMPAVYDRVIKDYPEVSDRGSFSLAGLSYGPAFAGLLDELNGDAFRRAVEEKFALDLTGKPTMITVRGKCGKKDGKVHTDAENKIITLLLYLNDGWEKEEGGRLRLLRSANLDDVAAEIPPGRGTLLVFRRSDHSWHGHKPFNGARKVVQMNWVTDRKFVDLNYSRHGLSSIFKRLNPFNRY